MISSVRVGAISLLAAFLFLVTVAGGLPPSESHPDTPMAVPAGPLHVQAWPTILSESPANGSLIGTKTPLIAVAYSDSAMVVAVDFHLDSMNLTSAGFFNQTLFTLPLALELRDGPHLANFAALDDLGGMSFWNWTFTVDTVPPILFVTAPAYPMAPTSAILVEGTAVPASSIFAGAVPINVSVTVLPSHRVQWAFAAANGSFSVPVLLSEGLNTLFVNATDRLGNLAYEIKTVVSDTTKPSLLVLSPANLSVSATSVVRVSGVTEFGAFLTVNGFSVAVLPNGTWSVDLALSDGPQPVVVVAADTVGNTNVVVRMVLVDSDVPQVTLTSPLVPLTNRSEVVVSGYVSDSNVVAVLVNFVPVPFNATSGYFSTTLPLSGGFNPIVVVAVDAAQHRGVAQTGIFADLDAPVIHVTGPPDGLETNQSTVVVSGIVDDVNATVLANGQQVRPNPDGTWRTTIALLQGANTIVVSAVDAAGNKAREVRILVTYYPPWYGLDNRISDNEKAFAAWGSTLSLGLAAVLLFLSALVLILYLRLDKRIVRLRGTRSGKPACKPASEPSEAKEK